MYNSDLPHGLMFHRFHPSNSLAISQGSINENDFEEILKFVGIERIITPENWLLKIQSNELKSTDLCITFDDSLMSQIEVALPVLNKYNLKAFWFIFSSVFKGEIDKNEIYNIFFTTFYKSFFLFFQDFMKKSSINFNIFNTDKYRNFRNSMNPYVPILSEIEIKFRYLRNQYLENKTYDEIMNNLIISSGTSFEQISKNVWMIDENIKNLDENGHLIGLHSYKHPYVISNLSYKEQQSEYSKNYNHIYNIINKNIKSMSHPFNSYSQDTLSILSDMNIICGFRSNLKMINNKRFSKLETPREDCANIIKLLN